MPETTRSLWIDHLTRLVRPVLSAAAEHRLRRDMPVEEKPRDRGGPGDRAKFTHLEALARSLVGAAPWLQLADDPSALHLAATAREAIHNCLDPNSPDAIDFDAGHQVIVDTAFLAHAFLRAPDTLWSPLPDLTKTRILDRFTFLRRKAPAFSNWLLFSAITEAFLKVAGAVPDPMRVDYALRQHEQWYVGGGWYKDGPNFHLDYYNSFVIQPMLLDTAERFAEVSWIRDMLPEWRKRARRHAELQERMIAPDGSFPVTGRSIAYRCGAFQHLATMALRHDLPETISPAQVRVALTSVIRRTLEPPGTYDPAGFLRIGLAGHQPDLGETYISTGSLYLASAAFLPLGLPASDPFWSTPDAPTTWSKAFSGTNLPADHD
jgi:hypothetical protein